MRFNFCRLAILSASIATAAGASPPDVRWVQRLGGTGGEHVMRVAADANGNCYAVGYTSSTNFVLGTNMVIKRSSMDAFVAKFDPQSSNGWIRTAGAERRIEARAVAVDQSGNVYVTGSMQGNATFDSTNLIASIKDAYLAKYTANGNLAWVRQAWDPQGLSEGQAVSVSGSNVIWVGTCNQAISAKEGVLLTNVSVFAAFYTLDGELTDLRKVGYSAGQSFVYDVIATASGEYYIGSDFTGPTFQAGATTVSRSGGISDGLVTKWDASGNLLWLKQARGFFGQCHAMALNSDGSVDVLGRTFDPGDFEGVPLQDAFLARISATGAVLSVKALSTNMPVWRLAHDRAGNRIIGAELPQGGTDFCGMTLTNSSGWTLPLIAKLDPAGNVLWVKTAVPAGTNSGYATVWGMAVAADGTVYFGGLTYCDFDLDSLPVRVQASDGYLARLDPEPPTLLITREGSAARLSWSTNPAGFALERSSSLDGPWTAVTNVPDRVGFSFIFSNMPNGDREFFRLRSED